MILLLDNELQHSWPQTFCLMPSESKKTRVVRQRIKTFPPSISSFIGEQRDVRNCLDGVRTVSMRQISLAILRHGPSDNFTKRVDFEETRQVR